ncbi:DoxX family protein [Gelidibacter salicanalis]|uniref:DoxX family protein n=1 Tax=Gelidibacter salicanalis TaxID=291193 RepID=A0A934KXD0_9FLAO|nr:DoxX family protein [Gelidibacter salicanalis]MBJ7882618.1 DoxX family protein [Gelidibacter salicanalis]
MKNNNLNDLAFAILRVSFSGMMLTHGIPKINMLLDNASGFPDPFGIGSTPSLIMAVIGEAIAPLFVLIGFKTRIAALPVIITMAVAAFFIHINDDFGTKEKALLYLFGFITIALVGAGRYSVDGKK